MKDFLEWKIDERYFSFNKDNKSDKEGNHGKRIIDIDELFDVAKDIDTYIAEESVSNYLERLVKCEGIGFVYAIAILYFCTGGKYPIYD